MRIILFKKMTFATGLTFEESNQVMDILMNHPTKEYYNYFTTNEGSDPGLWSLCAYVRDAANKFIARPEGFIIELQSEDKISISN